MNKAQIIKAVAKSTRFPKSQVTAIVEAIFGNVAREEPQPGIIVAHLLRGNKVSLAGFGVFTTQTTGAREGRSPRTGEKLMIPASRRVSFKFSKGVKDTIRARFADGAVSKIDEPDLDEDDSDSDDGEE